MVGEFLAAAGVFFGITLGLLSVGAWENFCAVDDAVNQEASVIGVFYRTVDNLPDPYRTQLTDEMRAYTRREIDVSWPKQRQGIIPSSVGNTMVAEIQRQLTHIEPASEAQKLLQAEALHEFNEMITARRKRLASVTTSLPPEFSVGPDSFELVYNQLMVK